MKRLIIATMIIIGMASMWAISPDEVIRRMEANEVHETSVSEGRMITTDKYGTIERSFESWARGEEEMLLEFTSTGEEGQKILRTEDEIYLYFPDAEEILRIQGSAMRDSVMDSDFSYEDMTGGKGLLADYEAELKANETIRGIDCYVVELTAKRRSVPYHSQLIWVDADRFVGVKVHKFSRSNRLLKEMEVLEYRVTAGKTVPVRMIMRDTMKKDSSTEFVLDSLEIGVSLDPRIFSFEELSW